MMINKDDDAELMVVVVNVTAKFCVCVNGSSNNDDYNYSIVWIKLF